jgi:hypothetical protein
MSNQIIKDFPNAVFFSFSHIYAELKDDKVKKTLVGLPNHGSITKTTINKNDKALALRTGKISGVTVIDFDIMSVYESFIKAYPNLEQCYRVKTNKGYHIYFNYDERLKTNSGVMDEYEGVDIRNDSNGCVICPPTAYPLPNGQQASYKRIGGKLIDFPNELISLFNHKGLVNAPKPEKEKKIKKVIVKEGKKVEVEIEVDDVERKTFTKIQLMALVELLDVKRSSDYSDWTLIGLIIHQCNNTQEGFEVFHYFSKKCPQKYTNENDCKNKWRSFSKDYSKVTIGSLMYYAKTDNKDGYDKIIDLFDEPEHFKSIEINQRYILEEGKDTVKNLLKVWMKQEDKLLNGIKTEFINKMFALKSAYDTGKTKTIHHILDEYKPQRVLFITYRQTLSFDLYGSFKRHNVGNYLLGDFKSDRLICQIESLPKLLNKNLFTGLFDTPVYDLVVIDEIESVLNHLNSPTIDNKLYTFLVMDSILKKSKRIIAMDGDFGNNSYDYLKFVNKDNDFDVVKNKCVPYVKTWKFTEDKANFEKSMIDDLRSGKKIYVSTMSSEAGEKLKLVLAKYNVLLHTSKGDDELKRKLQTVNELWVQYDCVICSPTVESGVDFNVEHFDKMYIILASGSTSQRGLNQMAGRVRNLKDLNVNVFLNGIPYKECGSIYKMYEIDELFDKHMKDHNISVDEDGNITCNNTAFTLINKYNYLETLNKNISMFIPYLVKLLKEKGQKYEYDGTKRIKQKEDRLTVEKLCETPLIKIEEYENLLKAQKKNQCSTEDKLKIEKYMYKVNWELDEISNDVMKSIYRKTHILNNQKAIYNEDSRPYTTIDDEYVEIDKKIRKKRLEIINQFLKTMKLKNSSNEFINGHIEGEEWDKLVEKSKTKCDIFTDKTISALFEKNKKDVLPTLTTNKKFIGHINTILKNYGIKIQSIRYGKHNKKSKYVIHKFNLTVFNEELVNDE